MSVTFYSLGAVEEVTGSKHILEVDGRSYLIDCGAFQGKRAVTADFCRILSKRDIKAIFTLLRPRAAWPISL